MKIIEIARAVAARNHSYYTEEMIACVVPGDLLNEEVTEESRGDLMIALSMATCRRQDDLAKEMGIGGDDLYWYASRRNRQMLYSVLMNKQDTLPPRQEDIKRAITFLCDIMKAAVVVDCS